MPAVCGQFEIGESAGQRLSGGMITDVWLISYADGSRIIAWPAVAWFQWVRCRPAPLPGGSRWPAVSADAGLGRGCMPLPAGLGRGGWFWGAEVHVQPDGGPGWSAAPLDQVAYLVDEP